MIKLQNINYLMNSILVLTTHTGTKVAQSMLLGAIVVCNTAKKWPYLLFLKLPSYHLLFATENNCLQQSPCAGSLMQFLYLMCDHHL